MSRNFSFHELNSTHELNSRVYLELSPPRDKALKLFWISAALCASSQILPMFPAAAQGVSFHLHEALKKGKHQGKPRHEQ